MGTTTRLSPCYWPLTNDGVDGVRCDDVMRVSMASSSSRSIHRGVQNQKKKVILKIRSVVPSVLILFPVFLVPVFPGRFGLH